MRIWLRSASNRRRRRPALREPAARSASDRRFDLDARDVGAAAARQWKADPGLAGRDRRGDACSNRPQLSYRALVDIAATLPYLADAPMEPINCTVARWLRGPGLQPGYLPRAGRSRGRDGTAAGQGPGPQLFSLRRLWPETGGRSPDLPRSGPARDYTIRMDQNTSDLRPVC
jgi:hypothetical protein